MDTLEGGLWVVKMSVWGFKTSGGGLRHMVGV